MKVSLALIAPFVLGSVHGLVAPAERVTPDARCNFNKCLDKAARNINHGNDGCKRYYPVTVTPKPTTVTRTRGSASTTVTKTRTITDNPNTKTITKTSTSFTKTKTVTRTVSANNALDKRALHTLHPLPVPAFAKKACKNYSQFSSACKCLGHTRTVHTVHQSTITSTTQAGATATRIITRHDTNRPKTTVTRTVSKVKTTTKTLTSNPTQTDCASTGNQGLEFANYLNTFGRRTDRAYSQFEPQAFKKATPRDTGKTPFVANFANLDLPVTGSEQISIYDDYEFDSEEFVLNHRGYIYAPQAGDYVVTAQANDISLFWYGDKAYSGWKRSNADLTATQGIVPKPLNITLKRHSYTPIRLVYANAQNSASQAFTITQPDGTVLLNFNSQDDVNIVNRSCDNTTAPAFEAFGDES